MTDNSFNDDSFVRNPPIPLDIEQFSLQDSLFSSKSSSPPLSNSFNISSFNINGLKMYSQNKIEQLSNFFSLKHISFGGVVDTHLHPKQMQFLSKRLSNYTVFSSPLDTSQHVRSSGGVSLFVENSLASHVHTYTSLSSRLLAVDLYFKGNVKLRIFVVYIPPTSDQALRDITIDLLIQALSEAKRLGFHHAICGDFNMHLDQFYLVFFNQPQMASKRIHRLFNFLLSNGYVDYTPINSSVSLGTFSRADIITRIDYIWSCPLLKSFLLTSYIFDGCDRSLSDHNPVITYFDSSLLHSSIKLAHTLCNISPSTFATWHINRMCEYLHSSIITGANAVLPSRTIGNDHIPKLPKDLETLLQHYRFLGRVLHSIRILRKHPHTLSSSHDHKWSVYLIRLNNIFRLYKSCFLTTPVLPPTLSSCRADNFKCVYDTLSRSSHLLRGLHLLKKKEYQESSIRSHIEQRDQNFDTDISSFIDSALSRSRQRIVLDRVFIDHPSTSRLLTDPSDISDAVVNHFQHAVPVKATSPSTISALPDRWHSEYLPMDSISPSIYDSLLSPPSLDEWLTVISSMPNGKAMITYEMLKHLSPTTNALLLILICKCFASADIPDLWRQAMVFPIPKPHEWRCQLKNTWPITLLEVIRKSFVKLFYNRLSSVLATHNVLTGGNFAGLLGGTCRDPIITLESIIHYANCYKSPLWILSQDISKAFDSVHLTMLKFALECIRLLASSINLILSLFMNRSNRVFTAHGDTPSYRVHIGIDQGEVISPLLWVIYIDPLLTVLKKEMLDPYILRSPSLLSSSPGDTANLAINNLVFMDDSTLISSTKTGLEHMLSIMEEFYALNNTSANHQKYVLISNSLSLTTTSTLSPVEFNLSLSSLNNVSSISVTPISITSSFQFLGVWFNIKGSHDFVKKQIAGECNSFTATLRPAKLSAKQVVYLYNTVLIPKLEYRMQVTHLSDRDCYTATRLIRSLVKHKANFSRALPNPILYLSQALGLINLSSHLVQCHVNNLFLMANSSTSFIQRLFVYRLKLIQFQFLIPISPLMVVDWSLWSKMTAFNCDYIACTIASMISTPFWLQHASFTSLSPDLTLPGHTPLYSCMSPKVFKACLKVLRKYHLYYLSQLITPTGSHLISWTVYRTAYIAQLADKRGHSLPHKWYLDIQAATTIPDSHDRLYNRYVCSPSAVPAVSLVPGATTNQKNRRWLVTLDNNAAPLFGKQLSVQSKKDTCVIVHWISDCLSSPGDVIRLRSCPGCDAHVPFPSATKYTAVTPQCTFTISLLRSLILPTDCDRIQQSTTDVISSHSWADIQDLMISYYNRLSISPDFSSSSSDPRDDLDGSLLSRDLLGLPSPVVLPPGSHYRFYTDGSLINLSSPDVSMGWSWVQIIHDAGFLNSVASYAHGTIRNWPSSSRAEAAAIFTALSITPHDSVVSIYTDSQVAIDGLRSCVSSTYTNSRSYYKTTNFELWASIECSIRQRRLTVLSVKVKGHDGNYWNEFADSLANSAHHSDDAVLLPIATLASLHNVRLIYDEVICESNPRRLIKTYFQATYMQDLLSLKRFQFIFCLGDRDDYVVDWDLTWFTLNYSPVHDASFQAHHASRYYTFKFKLFLDELPLLEKLKITCPDLYIDLLTC
ncbi:hypothetical protein RclHR1_18820006 [Rhizophagus clarus]|uniref:RNA-directed DNA polymerase from mobile element jockey-like n=1 Tax=Rhizophagus clarus TaxID=94130 RepID=A0A2Z6R0E6_9GLOM|nr:hypothetical protein RclHR1_18820006 [Rhizophagus clarus]